MGTGRQFSKDVQPGERKPRGKSKNTVLLETIADTFGDEGEFYTDLLKRGMNPRDPAGPRLMQEVLVRAFPLARATMPHFEFDYRRDGTPAERCDDIAAAVADGSLPVDAGKMMVDIIKGSMEIKEVTELAERLERLEALLNGET